MEEKRFETIESFYKTLSRLKLKYYLLNKFLMFKYDDDYSISNISPKKCLDALDKLLIDYPNYILVICDSTFCTVIYIDNPEIYALLSLYLL